MLVRLASIVDRDVVVEAYADAIKAKIEQKPMVLLLAGDRLAPLGELAQAIDDHRRRNPGLADVLLPGADRRPRLERADSRERAGVGQTADRIAQELHRLRVTGTVRR